MNWQVYMIRCCDDSLYCGITTDIDRRFKQHASGSGAKYFRGRRPELLAYLESGHDRSSASRREYELKRLRRSAKELLVARSLQDRI
ncbi:MAG TPA: GIY-YIG nuclease family protein [Malonomonas sp.]